MYRGARSWSTKATPVRQKKRRMSHTRVGYDGSNGPYFNNDKSPWFDATTDTGRAWGDRREISPSGVSLSRNFYLIDSPVLCLRGPTGRFKTECLLLPFEYVLSSRKPYIFLLLSARSSYSSLIKNHNGHDKKNTCSREYGSKTPRLFKNIDIHAVNLHSCAWRDLFFYPRTSCSIICNNFPIAICARSTRQKTLHPIGLPYTCFQHCGCVPMRGT